MATGLSTYVIRVTSNAEEEFAKGAAAAKMFNASLKDVHTGNIRVATTTSKAKEEVVKKTTEISKLSQVMLKYKEIQKRTAFVTSLLSKANRTAGLNIMGLSIRIGEWFIPVMFLMYTAMLPVIAGLLAIGTAAAVATLGVAGLVGVGLAKWSHDYNKTSSYAGARRPYNLGSNQKSFMDELFKPLFAAMDAPDIRDKINEAVDMTKELFGKGIPNAFSVFIRTVDMKVMRDLMRLFNDWLPSAARSLAEWGSVLTRTIGGESLRRVNAFFKAIAGAIMGTAIWLKDGGFDQLDQLFSVLGKIIGKLTELGGSVLPTLTAALEGIYPSPFVYIVDKLISFFDALSANKAAMGLVTGVIKLVTWLIVLKYLFSGVAAVLTPFVWLMRGITAVFSVLTGTSILSLLVPLLSVLAYGLVAILVGLALHAIYKYRWEIGNALNSIWTGFVNMLKGIYNFAVGIANDLFELLRLSNRIDTLEYGDVLSTDEFKARMNAPSTGGFPGERPVVEVNVTTADPNTSIDFLGDVLYADVRKSVKTRHGRVNV